MKRLVLVGMLGAFLIAPSNSLVAQSNETTARSKQNMVTSVHPLATDAGIAAFAKGGNE